MTATPTGGPVLNGRSMVDTINSNRPLVVLISGGRCSFLINRYDQYNWKSIAPHSIDRYWRAMQVVNLLKCNI